MSITSAKSGATGISLALENNFMEPIASTLVGSGGAGSIIFDDIPQTYKHLQIRGIGRSTTTGNGTDYLYIQFNGDNGSNYAWHTLAGDGGSASAAAGSTQSVVRIGELPRVNQTASSFGAAVIDILDYTNTSKYKTVRGLSGMDYNGLSNTLPGQINLRSGLWMNTSNIVSIKLYPEANNFVQYSRISLYGIRG